MGVSILFGAKKGPQNEAHPPQATSGHNSRLGDALGDGLGDGLGACLGDCLGDGLGDHLGGHFGDDIGTQNHRWGRPEAAPTDGFWGAAGGRPPISSPK